MTVWRETFGQGNHSYEIDTIDVGLRFVSVDAARGTDSMDGISLYEHNSPPYHSPTIIVPTLGTAMGGTILVRDNEIHYELSGAKDKDFVVVEGAEHGQTACVRCDTGAVR